MKQLLGVKEAFSNLLLMVLLLVIIPNASYAGSWNGWIYQDPYPTSSNLYTVKFITPQKGWVAGEQGAILFTEDSGVTWEYQKSGTHKTIKSIFFVNERQGWAVGGENESSGEAGVIIHSDDGGKTWIRQKGELNSSLNSVFFIDDKDGWIAGDQGVLLHTIDGGKRWERIRNAYIKRAIASVYFINSQTGWILAGDEIYRTVDGGKNWNRIWLDILLPKSRTMESSALSITGAPVQPDWNQGDLYFINEKKGWAVLGFWHILYTQDGGQTWTNQFSTKPMSYDFRHISFSNAKKGCASGSSIVCTEDGGKTWHERLGVRPRGNIKIDNFSILLQDISLVNQSVGWTVGKDGQIMKTEDGGFTWKMIARNIGCGKNVFFINKKTGWLHGNGSSLICVTEDGGITFQKRETGIDVWSVFLVNETTGWAVGTIKEGTGQATKIYASIRRTNDGGKTWQTQFKELMGNKRYIAGLYNVFFLNAETGWVVGKKGTILHTEDGGEHWEHQKSGDSNFDLMSVQFLDSKEGWITGIKVTDTWIGVVLHTTNSGRRWHVQYTNESIGLENLFFTDKQRGWITGETEWGGVNAVFRTSDGGKVWSQVALEGTELKNLGLIYPAFHNNNGILTTDKWWLVITADGGTTWKKTTRLSSKYPWYFLDLFKGK